MDNRVFGFSNSELTAIRVCKAINKLYDKNADVEFMDNKMRIVFKHCKNQVRTLWCVKYEPGMDVPEEFNQLGIDLNQKFYYIQILNFGSYKKILTDIIRVFGGGFIIGDSLYSRAIEYIPVD